MHEEAARSRSSGSQATADPADRETESSGAYFLDDVSDDDMDEDDGNDGAGGSQGGRPPAQITAEQLAAALASAASGGGNPFMGVTGMAPQQQGRSSGGGGAGSSQSTAATTPAASSRLTADMFQVGFRAFFIETFHIIKVENIFLYCLYFKKISSNFDKGVTMRVIFSDPAEQICLDSYR